MNKMMLLLIVLMLVLFLNKSGGFFSKAPPLTKCGCTCDCSGLGCGMVDNFDVCKIASENGATEGAPCTSLQDIANKKIPLGLAKLSNCKGAFLNKSGGFVPSGDALGRTMSR